MGGLVYLNWRRQRMYIRRSLGNGVGRSKELNVLNGKFGIKVRLSTLENFM